MERIGPCAQHGHLLATAEKPVTHGAVADSRPVKVIQAGDPGPPPLGAGGQHHRRSSQRPLGGLRLQAVGAKAKAQNLGLLYGHPQAPDLLQALTEQIRPGNGGGEPIKILNALRPGQSAAILVHQGDGLSTAGGVNGGCGPGRTSA